MKFDAAITYAERHTLHALIVLQDGAPAASAFGTGWSAARAHPLYSGTKSFWGIAAAAAVADGLLDFDEPVAATIEDFARDALKSRLTIRQLLNLTSGYGFGGLGNAVPTVERALAIPLKDEPGRVFRYGGVPLQIFGEVLRRKVAPAFTSPHDYLQRRVLDPIGMEIDRWRILRDGTQPLPTGAFVSAGEWLKFGGLLLACGAGVVPAAVFARCLEASPRNPGYALSLRRTPEPGEPGVLYATGSGGQGLYVLPDRRIIAVHFGQSASWDHAAFIRRLADGS